MRAMEYRFPAPRPGKISQQFVDKLREFGASARLLRDLAQATQRDDAMEEMAAVDLNYVELCTLLDSGTVEEGSALYVKLRTARDAFLRRPKVYGKGFGPKMKEGK
jgi:hypothetical protein